MSSFNGTDLREIYLTVPSARNRWERLLRVAELEPELDPDYTVGVFDAEDELIGTASLAGDVIKYVAIHPSHRGEAVANTLITAILNHALVEGITDPVIYTKPEYETLFKDLSFKPVGATRDAVMLEHTGLRLSSYSTYLKSEREKYRSAGGKTGVIVMNTNPLTRGHLHLIKTASDEVDQLFIIPLQDAPSNMFSYATRTEALKRATKPLRNVAILEGSRYCISNATFPSYFIKERTRLTDAHITLDLDIFVRHIAPALGATIRFVGEEPTDALTARYNELMKAELPKKGIEVREIARLEDACGIPISASRVRTALKEGRIGDILPLIPSASVPGVLAQGAALALTKELELTPKPGLVDKENNGSHKDMDLRVMRNSIIVLTETFEKLATKSMRAELPDSHLLQPIGLEGERKMFAATSGVNTHRGALFSLGLTVSVAAHLISNSEPLTEETLGKRIAEIAKTFPRQDSTNGALVGKQYNIPTALDTATAGYPELMKRWRKIENPYRRLLTIMSALDDSNIYHRGGREGDQYIKAASLELLKENGDGISLQALSDLDAVCQRLNLSPGGSADMLALSFLINSLLSEDKLSHTTEKKETTNNNNLKN